MGNEEKIKIKGGLVTAFIFLSIIWIIKLIELNFSISFSQLGIYPRKAFGLVGIITAPLIHKDMMHLFNNSIPLFVSIIGISYFFRKAAFKIFILAYLCTNLLIWIIARPSYHIGASGLVYGLLSFLFFASTFAKDRNMLALALAIIFVYGAFVWGIIPTTGNNVSWESHLMGAIVGFVLAIVYRDAGPVPVKYDWEEEDENIDDMTDEEIDELIDEKLKIKYWYKRTR